MCSDSSQTIQPVYKLNQRNQGGIMFAILKENNLQMGMPINSTFELKLVYKRYVRNLLFLGFKKKGFFSVMR